MTDRSSHPVQHLAVGVEVVAVDAAAAVVPVAVVVVVAAVAAVVAVVAVVAVAAQRAVQNLESADPANQKRTALLNVRSRVSPFQIRVGLAPAPHSAPHSLG